MGSPGSSGRHVGEVVMGNAGDVASGPDSIRVTEIEPGGREVGGATEEAG